MNSVEQFLLEGDYGAGLQSPETTMFMVLLAFVIGQFVGWVYMATHVGLSYSRSFVASLVVLPVTIALMMVVMAGSIVVAFGLLAVFAVIRFNSVLTDTLDTTFVLWAIVEGVGIGTQRYSTSVMAAVGVSLVLLYVRVTAFGIRDRFETMLELHLRNESLGVTRPLRNTLRLHCTRISLAHRAVFDGGVQHSYRLVLRDPDRSTEFRSDLERTDGVVMVSLYQHERDAEL